MDAIAVTRRLSLAQFMSLLPSHRASGRKSENLASKRTGWRASRLGSVARENHHVTLRKKISSNLNDLKFDTLGISAQTRLLSAHFETVLAKFSLQDKSFRIENVSLLKPTE